MLMTAMYQSSEHSDLQTCTSGGEFSFCTNSRYELLQKTYRFKNIKKKINNNDKTGL